MGGPGSGRWGDRPPRSELAEFRWISITDLTRRMHILPGRVSKASVFTILGLTDVVADCVDRLWPAITVRFSVPGEHGLRAVESLFAISSTEPHYGGLCWWLHCPSCGSRRKTLFAPWDFAGQLSRWSLWRCRVCLGLAYPNQSLGPRERAQRRIETLVERLGGVPGQPPRVFLKWKPKGMHGSTFRKLERRLQAAITHRDNHWPVKSPAPASSKGMGRPDDERMNPNRTLGA